MTFYAYRFDEYEWWAGRDIDEAIAQAIAETGLSKKELIDSSYFTNSPEDSDMLIYVDVEKSSKIKVHEFLESFTHPGFAFGLVD